MDYCDSDYNQFVTIKRAFYYIKNRVQNLYRKILDQKALYNLVKIIILEESLILSEIQYKSMIYDISVAMWYWMPQAVHGTDKLDLSEGGNHLQSTPI